MKKLFLLCALMLCCTMPNFASSFIVDGILYRTISDDAVEVSVKDKRYHYASHIIIPENVTYNDSVYQVTAIGNDAFNAMRWTVETKIESITLPNTIKSIGERAFAGCEKLASFTIPSSVTAIGIDAFENCTALTSIIIPASVTSIGSVSAPNIFEGCSSLSSIFVEEGNPIYCSRENCLINKERKELITGCNSSVIPSDGSVERITISAFERCSGLKTMSIPNSVKYVGYYAFANCSDLESVTLSENLEKISMSAFSCDKIKYNEYNGGKYLGTKSNPYYALIEYRDTNSVSYTIHSQTKLIAENAFGGRLSKLTSIILPNSVKYLTSATFSGCENLQYTIYENAKYLGSTSNPYHALISENTTITSCKIHNSTKIIADNAFYNHSYITSITGGSSLETIGQYAFSNCPKLVSVVLPSNVVNIGMGAFYDCANLSSITLGNKIKSIGSWAFYQCPKLQSITIPNSVTSIGMSAFNGCTNLTSITIPNNVTELNSYTFYECTNLTSITLSNNINTIGAWAFAGCSALQTINLPNNINSLGIGIFYGCSKLESTNIPNNIRGLPAATFSKCSNLKSITIPTNVTKIGREAFYSCTNLKSINLPNNLQHLGNQAFALCSNLSSITIPSTIDSIGDYTFYNCSKLESVTLPYGIKKIGLAAFYQCSSLTSITIPNSVTKLGRSAFYYCSNLESIHLGNQLQSIDDWAFEGCSALQTINLPSNLTTLSKGVFQGCTNLQSINLPNNLQHLGNQAFALCSNLSSITIPSTIDSIGDYTFYGCSSLKSITAKANIPQIVGDSVFYNVPTDATLTVPCSTATLYSTADGWKKFSTITEDFVYDFKVASINNTSGLAQIIQEPNCEQDAIINAQPNSGYEFITWSDGNTSAERNITVTKDIDLVALFAPIDGNANVEDITVTPTTTTASFTWPAVEGAAKYTLLVSADVTGVDSVCILTFDAVGRLISTDFMNRKPAKEQGTGYGLNFVVVGLEENTTYYYTLDAKDADNMIIDTKNGIFTTSATAVEDIFMEHSSDSVRKVFENGVIYILRNGERYTVDGRVIE